MVKKPSGLQMSVEGVGVWERGSAKGGGLGVLVIWSEGGEGQLLQYGLGKWFIENGLYNNITPWCYKYNRSITIEKG